MLPDPLHPALVHFPIVFAVLLPIVAIAVLWALRTGVVRTRAWGLVVALASALTVASWLTVQSGEQQEERVEEVVAEAALETHEEAAELFLLLTWAALVVAAAGIAPGVVGSSARIVSVVVAMLVLMAGWRVGHSGGELVYRHGAAQAYAPDGGWQETPELELSSLDESLDDESDD
jgi:uncharacterized membrane protein